MSDEIWTEADLDLFQSLDATDVPIAQIARRLGRSETSLQAHLAVVRARPGTLPLPERHDPDDGPEPWLGPDEEGDVPLSESDDPAAWTHDGTGSAV